VILNFLLSRVILITCPVLCLVVGAQAESLAIVAKAERGQIVQIAGQSGVGSGFWINEGGYVATCFHVVNQSSPDLEVRSAVDINIDLESNSNMFDNWQRFTAAVVVTDSLHDVAILKVTPNPFKFPPGVSIKMGDVALSAHYQKASLDVKLPDPGESILIAGYPLGLPYLVFQEGTVASIAIMYSSPKILLSAVANHGNSGGPVYNDRGNVIGLLEGEVPGQQEASSKQSERTGLELVVPVFYVEILMKLVPASP
jgi:serine protease Do